MARNLQTALSTTAIAAGVTNYGCIGIGVCQNTSTTESDAQITVRSAGTYSNLNININTNTLSGSHVFTFRKNTAAGNQTMSIGAAATGFFQDSTNTDSVVATDVVCVQGVAAAGTGTITPASIGVLFNSTSSNISRHVCTRPTGRGFTTDSTANYMAFAGSPNTGGAELNSNMKMKTPGTFVNFFVRILNNSRITTTTVSSRKNAGAGSLTVSISAAATGIFEDTANNDSIAVDDLHCVVLTTSTGGGTITVQILSVEFNSTQNKFYLMSNGQGATLATVTHYDVLGGAPSITTTEALGQTPALSSFAFTALAYYASANTTTAASTIRLRINAANGNNVISVGSGATGYFEDTSPHEDRVGAADKVNFYILGGATGTSITSQTYSILVGGSNLPKGVKIMQAINRSNTY